MIITSHKLKSPKIKFEHLSTIHGMGVNKSNTKQHVTINTFDSEKDRRVAITLTQEEIEYIVRQYERQMGMSVGVVEGA